MQKLIFCYYYHEHFTKYDLQAPSLNHTCQNAFSSNAISQVWAKKFKVKEFQYAWISWPLINNIRLVSHLTSLKTYINSGLQYISIQVCDSIFLLLQQLQNLVIEAEKK